ncbi:MAG: hypothetical protein JWM16_4133, partial [Verrucomicrobiales bacterium]|nr:hypothetical protein [Verrucomicrobiales bacterium]
LRIFLILAILAGIGVIAVSQLKIKPHIQSIVDERELNKTNWHKEENTRKQKEKELAATKTTLESTKKNLDETTTQLTSTKGQLDAEQKRANDLQSNLAKSRDELKGARQDLEAWRLLGIPVEQVRVVIVSEKKLHVANDALEEEKKVIKHQLDVTEAKLKTFLLDEDPDLPTGLKGTVLVVDPKWNFVVLNIGEKQGVVPRGVLLVSRNSKLIGKVRVQSTQGDRSIANVMPGWKLGEIMEGDEVLYAKY